MAELHLRWNIWGAPYLLAGAMALVIASLVVSRGRGALRRPFFVLCTVLGFTLLSVALVMSAGDARSAIWLVRGSQVMAVWTSPAAVIFASAASGRPLLAARRSAVAAAIAGSFIALSPWVIRAARAYPYGYAGVAGPLYPLAILAMSLSLVSPWVLVGAVRAEPRPLERRQLMVVLVASLLGGLAFVDTLPVLGLDVPPLGWIPLLISAVTLLFAIVRYRLLAIRLALRRTLLWAVLTTVGAAPFVALAIAVGPRLGKSALGLGLLFALLVIGMRAWVVLILPRLERLIGRRRLDLDAEMAVLAANAGTLQSTEELGRAIDRFLAAVDRRLAALVVIDPTGRPRVALSAWGAVPPPSRGSPLLLELAGARTLISRDHAHGPARIEIERACVRWGADLLGPLVEGDTLHGLIAISPKLGGGLADAVELDALDRMCVTVTAALAGARLYEQLRGLARELEQKAQARSASLAKTLGDLRGAEARLVESEKLASLGQIVAGVAGDLDEQVRGAIAEVARLREHAEVLVIAAEEARASRPELAGAAFEEASRDVGPLLDAISEGARRAHLIASDLARFAPSDLAPRPSVPRRSAHLAALIDSTLTLVTNHLADVAVVRDYDERVPPLEVEVGPLGQVILNLLLNAAQAMRGSGTLTVSTRHAGDHAEFSVADDGPGIPPDALPHIFEPFFTTKGPTAGTGLGLSISYGIVARHGGRISVETAPGRTRFVVQLPIASPT